MVPELSATLTRARELAQKKRQPLSTAHVLVALFQEDAIVAGLCARLGVSEATLLSALGHVYDEHPSGIDLALERARKLAAAAGSPSALPLHLLFTLIKESRSAASAGLARSGVPTEALIGAAWELLSQNTPPEPAPVSAHARHERSRARGRQPDRFRSLELSQETESKLQRKSDSVPPPRTPLLSEEAEAKLRRDLGDLDPQPFVTPKLAPRTRIARTTRHRPPPTAAVVSYGLEPSRFPLLAAIGRNLTQLAAAGDLDPVIGRDHEIEQLLDVLARRRGNNPVLVGAAGVGKNAVVEGLALALVRTQADMPNPRELIEISASSLLVGTGVRGALSERVQTLRSEVAASGGRVLLFIDEIHSVLGAGEGEALGNELKTALARGELPVIGATTDAEYRRSFERDPALSRRFTRLEVNEPSQRDSLAILQAIAPKYARHHGVSYEPASLTAAVELSVRYLPLRQLPDKAIGLIDQAAARAQRRGQTVVDEVGIAQVVSELARVPVERLLMNDRDALLQLERHLTARVVGQSRAVECIASALRKSAAGFRGERPLGTFLFTGPTGVGKTEMAKAIAEVLFPGIPITRIDLSEYAEAHSLARLLGAPPGYIGHEEGGQLTEAVRHRPYQLVLLDEIEKAHMEVLLALLPLLDAGRLSDGRGRTIDFTNTVIVMTSNLGAEGSLARGRIGFGEEAARDDALDRETHALTQVRAVLPPELFNRIDEPLFFFPLSEAAVAEIAHRMLSEVAQLMRDKHGVNVELETSAIDALLAAGGFDRKLGARPMRRTIGRLVEAPLARALLARELSSGDDVCLRGRGAGIEIIKKPNDRALLTS